MRPGITRREVLAAGAVAIGTSLSPRATAAPEPRKSATPPTSPGDVIRRKIPSSGAELPAIGLGSWQTFDVDDAELPAVQQVIGRFLALGGRLIDSSPMYGRSEKMIGAALRALRSTDAFLATKVWVRGRAAGETQMRRSIELMSDPAARPAIDLMQIHNLVDWKTHLETLRAWKQAGTFRYIGITHYDHSAFDDLEQIVRKEKIDFLQIPYSVVDRAVEKRLLPAAQSAGVAVLVMQPFESGALFQRVKGKPVPTWAADLDCTSWSQLFLKFLLGHPAVTAPLPATAKLHHLEDNLGALRGRLPDEAQRKAIIKAVG
jgi:aryl-alcohol dehydrogenase-like predicted oxidoreductase